MWIYVFVSACEARAHENERERKTKQMDLVHWPQKFMSNSSQLGALRFDVLLCSRAPKVKLDVSKGFQKITKPKNRASIRMEKKQ